MTKEQKQLLIKDLCGRLLYGVNVLYVKEDIIGVLSTINIYLGNNAEGKQELMCTTSFFGEDNVPIEEFKPYLYPLSSMTEEQRVEASLEFGLKKYKVNIFGDIESYSEIGEDIAYIDSESIVRYIDWLNAHHFDYRGLIEQGLAIDATGIKIYDKEVQS